MLEFVAEEGCNCGEVIFEEMSLTELSILSSADLTGLGIGS